MKLILLRKMTFAAALLVAIYGCEKTIEPISTYAVTVEYGSTNAKSVKQDLEVNPKDSIYLDFTVTSPKDMAYIEIQRNGIRVDTFNVSAATKNKFTGSKAYRMDSIPGDYTYRVVALNSNAVFLGDGNKKIKITVKPDFNFYSYRILSVPDTTSKTNKCYYSTTTGEAFSFTEGATKSALIDFAYYYDTTSTIKHSIYALNAPQTQLAFYDISAWTKNATIFKKLPSSVNFVSGLTSGGALLTVCSSNLASGATTKVSTLSTVSGNNVIAFKTAAGKFGAILIRFISQDLPAKSTQIEVDVKVQK